MSKITLSVSVDRFQKHVDAKQNSATLGFVDFSYTIGGLKTAVCDFVVRRNAKQELSLRAPNKGAFETQNGPRTKGLVRLDDKLYAAITGVLAKHPGIVEAWNESLETAETANAVECELELEIA